MLRCPQCHATTEIRDEAARWPVCAHCGQMLDLAAAESDRRAQIEQSAAEDHFASPAEEMRAFVSPLRRVLAAASRLTPCPDCGNPVSRKAVACPKCGRVLKQTKKSPAAHSKWRAIVWGTVVFIGLPAAIIFLVFELISPQPPTGGHHPRHARVKTSPQPRPTGGCHC
jgi:endogenous inhibitor of DNA gyrase (YacG/DUF329 family)